MLDDLKPGDRVHTGSLFTKSDGTQSYGPYATVIGVYTSPAAGGYVDYRIDGWDYKLDLYPTNCHHFTKNTWVQYGFAKAEYKYEPSQEGDKEDDI